MIPQALTPPPRSVPPHGRASLLLASSVAALLLGAASPFVPLAPAGRTAGHRTSAPPAPLRALPRLSEDDLARPPDPRVVAAASSSPGGSVTAADVSSSAGVPLAVASRDLSALASLSGGDVAVSSDGELLYSFPSNLKGTLAANSARYRLDRAWREDIAPKAFYAVRIGFGVALLVSIAAIFSTIAFISASSSNSDDDRRRDNRRGGGGGMMNFGYVFGPSPLDFFYYRPYYGYYGNSYYDRRAPEAEPEMGLLESVFSYVFGDGDPNVGLEEKRLSAAADTIRRCGGAVSAEQLATFADDPPERLDDDTAVDESFVLPVVAKLGGEPTVTEDGDIVYLFPDLLTTSAAADGKETKILRACGLPPAASTADIREFVETRQRISIKGVMERDELVKILGRMVGEPADEAPAGLMQEAERPFSLASDLNKVIAAGLGAVNLGGALYLGQILSSPALSGVVLPGYMRLVQSGFPLLLGYAVLYNAIPAARFVWQKGQNAQIRERNRRRNGLTAAVEGAPQGSAVRRKLEAARLFAKRMTRIGAADVVYDTRMDASEEGARKEGDVLQAFDDKLKSSEN